MEGRRGESEGKLENCSGSGRGCCGKRWAGMGQETEAVLGVLRRRMGREGTGDRNVPKGGGGVSLSRNPWGLGAAAPGGYNRIWRHARQIRKKPCVARVSLHSPLAAP